MIEEELWKQIVPGDIVAMMFEISSAFKSGLKFYSKLAFKIEMEMLPRSDKVGIID